MKSTTADRLIPALLVALSVVPAIGGSVRLAEIGQGAAITPDNARFLGAPFPIVTHVVAALAFSVVGAFQFSPRIRRRHRLWHRRAGYLLIVSGLLVALSGLWMANFYPWPANDGELVYLERIVFGTAMLGSIVWSIGAIRRRDFVSHGHWMMRAYAIGMGAGTQVLTHLPWFVLVDGPPGVGSRAVMMGAGWVINVIVAEWIILRAARQRVGKARRSHEPTTRRPAVV